jgi:ssDNA-binding replication factor A large subunit
MEDDARSRDDDVPLVRCTDQISGGGDVKRQTLQGVQVGPQRSIPIPWSSDDLDRVEQNFLSKTDTTTSRNNVYPISSLSPDLTRWTIKARLVRKGEIKTWYRIPQDDQLCKLEFLDESGRIRATMLEQHIQAGWYENLNEGSIYYVSAPCIVEPAKRQFSDIDHRYELVFGNYTIIELVEDWQDLN